MSITHSDGIFPVFRWVRVCLSFLIGNIVKALTIFEGGKTRYLIQFLPQILLVASIGLAGFIKKENI